MNIAETATCVLFGMLCVGLGGVQALGIPEDLLECYRDGGSLQDNPLPLSTAALVSLVRKVERMQNSATLDLRTLSSTLLHRFRADGIERDPEAVSNEFVVAVQQSGRQAVKWKALAELLLPGNALLFPEESLNTHEKCALHVMLSTAVDPNECSSQTTNNASRPVEAGCRERGVVWDSWGSVSAGAVLTALCAAMQPQTVSLRELLAEELAAVLTVTRGQRRRRDREKLESLTAYSDMGAAAAVDSLWASTLAGDLSEVAVYQGPRTSSLVVGASGIWDDDMAPTSYRIPLTPYIDLTDAEIRGGIDGLVLGGGLRAWLEQMSRLRLSQVLEMYFSPRGVVLDVDGQLKACQRKQVLSNQSRGARLRNETLNMARLLYLRSDSPQMADAALQAYSEAAVAAFSAYHESALSGDAECNEEWDPPHVNLLVVTDATWTPDEATRLLTSLAQQADVSEMGSSFTLLDGRGGSWVLNDSRRFTDVPQALHNATMLSWSSGLDAGSSLQAASWWLLRQTGPAGGPATVLLLLAYSASLSDVDFSLAQQQLEAINASHPEAELVVVASDVNSERLQELLAGRGVVLVAADSRPETVVPLVTQHLVSVPGRLVPGWCNSTDQSVSDELELYLTPNITTRLRVHGRYLRSGTVVSVKVSNPGYGVVRACLSAEGAQTDDLLPSEGSAVRNGCGELTGGVLTLNASAPCDSSGCQPLLLQLTPTSSLHKCAEDDCRFPDQVRVVLRHTGLNCDIQTSSRSSGSSSLCRGLRWGLLLLTSLLAVALRRP